MLCELTDAGDERLKDQSVKRKYRAGWPSLEGGWPSVDLSQNSQICGKNVPFCNIVKQMTQLTHDWAIVLYENVKMYRLVFLYQKWDRVFFSKEDTELTKM